MWVCDEHNPNCKSGDAYTCYMCDECNYKLCRSCVYRFQPSPYYTNDNKDAEHPDKETAAEEGDEQEEEEPIVWEF